MLAFLLHFLLGREKLREDNVAQFRNQICLFSKYLKLAMIDGHKLLRLQSALMDYMEMLLETASAEDIEIFTEQVCIKKKAYVLMNQCAI